jgi:hypothetical protein
MSRAWSSGQVGKSRSASEGQFLVTKEYMEEINHLDESMPDDDYD